MMKLIEEISGIGELAREGAGLRRVSYRIRRYQVIMEGSGLPIPGLSRIEGSIEFDARQDAVDWIRVPLTLKLEDGRALAVTLAGSDGRVLSEGHGPTKCQCC